MNDSFQLVLDEIKNSNTYEDSKNWGLRGLTPSDKAIVNILRTSTNNFLKALRDIENSDAISQTKLEQISDLVDALPWDELDTEEREFLADTLAPAIQAAGFDPWSIF